VRSLTKVFTDLATGEDPAFYIREVLDEMGRPRSSASEHFPVAVVGLHGLLAATTIVLVLLTNVGVGGS
jgi:hypothetical protein